jgi:hypothetical protein
MTENSKDDEVISACEMSWDTIKRTADIMNEAYKNDCEIFRHYGLYWRTWPEEKPGPSEKVLLCVHKHPITWLLFDYMELHDGSITWLDPRGSLDCKPGDRWLPLSALEKLP